MTERNRCNCSTYLSLLHIMQGPQVNLQIDLNPGGVYEIDKNGPTEVFWKEHPSLEKGKPFYSVTLWDHYTGHDTTGYCSKEKLEKALGCHCPEESESSIKFGRI